MKTFFSSAFRLSSLVFALAYFTSSLAAAADPRPLFELIGAAQGNGGVVVSGERAPAVSSDPEAFKSAPTSSPAVLEFAPLDDQRLDAAIRQDSLKRAPSISEGGEAVISFRPRLVGLGRSAIEEGATLSKRLMWEPVNGGHAAWLDVVSPQAAALRVGFDASRWPEGLEVRVFDGQSVHSLWRSDREGPTLWTAVVSGDRQRLELFVPSDPPAFDPVVSAVSHLFADPLNPQAWNKALGDSAACMVNVSCAYASLGQAFVNVKDSVARMVFQIGSSAFTCTGTLLKDSVISSSIPYFFTAHHCIGNQTLASTLTTFWNYESSSCSLSEAGPNIQVSGGADFLNGQSINDSALLRLNNSPPASAWYSGWSAAALPINASVIGIHHPAGDNKKVSVGTSLGVLNDFSLGGAQPIQSGIRVSWQQGTTQGGSSGSGLFTLHQFASGPEFLLRGGLMGGNASCANMGQSEDQGNRDVYSRMDLVYPAISNWLNPSTPPPPPPVGPSRNYTGVWYKSDEGGWGLTLFQYPNGVLFGLVFAHDSARRPMWLQMDPRWTGSDVAAGRMVRWSGPPLGPTFNPNDRSLTEAGTFQINFTSQNAATLMFSVDGVSRSIPLVRIN